MCGICGLLYFEPDTKAEVEILQEMNTALSHRGPDDEGYYVEGNVGLAMRRLKIIDLETGHQPIFSEDKSICVVFNGEIYNFRELRRNLSQKGHIFRTDSDTEVIVHLYEEYGQNCVLHLRGMFSFALWDMKRMRLLLARDRIGIKPLHYYYDSSILVFGSEIKALTKHPSVPRELDHDALFYYLSFSYVPAPQTIFKGIRKLLPGHLLICDAQGVRLEQYWDVQFRRNNHSSESYLREELVDLLRESIQMHLVSDVPLGAFLSGGVDSSTVVAMAGQFLPQPLRTFSIGFRDQRFNESHDAQLVANRFHTQHEEFILDDMSFDPDIINEIFERVDEPFADSSMIPTYILSKLTRSKVTAALSGDGGDELFGGYPYYQYLLLLEHGRRLPSVFTALVLWLLRFVASGSFMFSGDHVRRIRRFAGVFNKPEKEILLFLRSLFSAEDKEDLLSNEFLSSVQERDVTLLFDQYLNKMRGESLVDQLLYLDLKTSLPDDMLAKVDRMSMSNSLEVRVPLLDHRVVEFAASIPSHLKVRYVSKKYLLKKALGGVLPDRVLKKRKMGFEIPLHNWADKGMVDFINDSLTEPRIKSQGIFQWKEVERLVKLFSLAEGEFNKKISRYQVNQRLWTLLSFQLWSQRFFH